MHYVLRVFNHKQSGLPAVKPLIWQKYSKRGGRELRVVMNGNKISIPETHHIIEGYTHMGKSYRKKKKCIYIQIQYSGKVFTCLHAYLFLFRFSF